MENLTTFPGGRTEPEFDRDQLLSMRQIAVSLSMSALINGKVDSIDVVELAGEIYNFLRSGAVPESVTRIGAPAPEEAG